LTPRQFFWDYICPFSGKSSHAVETILKPLLESPQYAGKVKIIMRPHPQPWHASSMLLHETALAVARVAPSKFWEYSLALFKAQGQFYDIPTATITPARTRENAAELGLSAGILTTEEVAAVKDLLLLKSTPNGGCAVTDDLKACSECHPT
jgi:protein-disulfide isomerase